MPNTIPMPEGSNPGPYGPNGIPEARVSVAPSASATPAITVAQYAVADAPSGFTCPPTLDGYECLLRFNVPPPTPTPAPGSKHRPSPTPSPTPTPTPTPASTGSPGGSPTPSPTPTPGVTLQVQALPSGAPAMYRTTPAVPKVVPVMMIRLSTSGDFPLTDSAIATFTLPKEQLGKRGFAIQVFQVQTSKKHVNYKPLWTFNKSSLKDQTLTFTFTPPKMTIPKGATYALVLYGDAVAIPLGAPSGAPSAAPTGDSGVPGVPGDMPVEQATAVASPAPAGT